jgi:hypothetical protein
MRCYLSKGDSYSGGYCLVSASGLRPLSHSEDGDYHTLGSFSEHEPGSKSPEGRPSYLPPGNLSNLTEVSAIKRRHQRLRLSPERSNSQGRADSSIGFEYSFSNGVHNSRTDEHIQTYMGPGIGLVCRSSSEQTPGSRSTETPEQ